MEIKVTDENYVEVRIDKFLQNYLDITRTKIASMIKDNKILVNGKSVKSSYVVSIGDVIEVGEYTTEPVSATPEKMDLDIVYEDDDVIVVNKENGMVVHPGAGNINHTLVNGLVYHSNQLSDINGSFRPGIVHRIDAYTTGLLMVAKNNKAHEVLARELEKKETKRVYTALVWGRIVEDSATIDAPIGRDIKDRKRQAVTNINSKDAVTHFKVLERYKRATLIELQLETGRTHQIRVHMNYINHPVVNDPVYGNYPKIDDTGQCLHAGVLGFHHPKTGKYLEFSAPLPECFTNILNKFKEEE